MKQECSEKKTIVCPYRENGYCTFWEKSAMDPEAWEKVFPEDSENDLRIIDTYREPCLG